MTSNFVGIKPGKAQSQESENWKEGSVARFLFGLHNKKPESDIGGESWKVGQVEPSATSSHLYETVRCGTVENHPEDSFEMTWNWGQSEK